MSTTDDSLQKDSTGDSTLALPLDGFHNWVACFAIIAFDLELGQVVERVIPEHYRISDAESANICYLSFPDSNTGCMGDTAFHFRIRSPSRLKPSRNTYNHDLDYLTGHVLFRQVKDPTIKRGYFQKSVVLLSRLPFVDLFLKLVQTIGPGYFENGEIALETVCYQIDKWPCPAPGKTLHLPVQGEVLQVSLPSTQLNTKTPSVANPLDSPCLFQPRIYQCFNAMLPHLHLLWELVLLGEPIVVMAPSPKLCSEGVQSLVSLIHPLEFMCDYRPYFTIHDSELKEYTTKTQAPPKIILGVTNPFFAKTLQQWPNIIRIGDMPSLAATRMTSSKSNDLKPGIYTKHKPCLNRDKVMLKKIDKGTNGTRPPEVQNAILCKSITELTQSFMIPLERYIGSLMPLQRSILPWKSPPKLRRFNIEEFISTLSNYGPQLTSKLKGNWTLLYRRFFKSANFEAWFCRKREEVNDKLEILHLQALCRADIKKWTRGKDEVEIVDLFMYMKNKLARSSNYSAEIRHELYEQMTLVLKSLPSDLQEMMKKNL